MVIDHHLLLLGSLGYGLVVNSWHSINTPTGEVGGSNPKWIDLIYIVTIEEHTNDERTDQKLGLVAP